MPKNYYIILGIPEDSSQADAKSAYRRLAKEFHPDHYGNNQNRFQVIHEAYSVLREPALRRRYDASLQGSIASNRQRFTEPLRRHPVTDQIEPLIPERVARDGMRLKNITVEIVLTPEQAS